MARMARVVAAGVPHHITQRGNNRQDVFLPGDDRRFYLETPRERSRRHRVTLLGYCLMTNHIHLVAIPERPDSLARALGQCHSRLRSALQPAPRADRAFVAEPLLFVSFRPDAPGAGAAVRGLEPGSRRTGWAG